MQVSYIEEVIKTTIFLINESFFLQELYSILKYTMNCLGCGVILKICLWEEGKEKKSKSHLIAHESNSLDQLVYEFTQQAFYLLSQKDPGMQLPSRIVFKEVCSGRIFDNCFTPYLVVMIF